jgi:pSer/pThr/pTyr-binding forkhead associated (FHA) protein
MPADLRVTSGRQRGQTFSLVHGSYTVGRRSQNDITLKDKSVSRQHCRLDVEGKRYWLVDNDSHNGTYVNGRRVQRTLLYTGDVIVLGKVELRFESI